MEMIPISNSKLKIMLDESDMREYNIGTEADCASNETRHAIRNILDVAKTQIGFNTEGEEIFVQLYTSKSGGCELFVTKSGMCDNAEQKNDKKSKKRESVSKKSSSEGCTALSLKKEELTRSSKRDYGRMIFSFESIDLLCTVCRTIASKKTEYESRAYFDEYGTYYLVLNNIGLTAYSRIGPLSFILEYGQRERSDHALTYLFEHGKVICPEHAVEILSQF